MDPPISETPSGVSMEGEAVHPAEWLLEAEEVADLWQAVAGTNLDLATAETWRAATDGWYLPLRLAAEAFSTARSAKHSGPAPVSSELVRLPALDAFLSYDVLGPSLEASAGEAGSALGWSPEDPRLEGFRLLDRESGAKRLPVLLRAFLERSQDSSPPGGAPDSEGAVSPASATRPIPSPATTVAPVGAVAAAGESSEPLYQVFLFGDAQVLLSPPQGEPREVSWTLNRGLSLFAYLASTPGRRAGKEELTEALFAGEGSEAIRRNFHPTLSYLRRDLGGGRDSSLKPVVYRSGGYELNPDYRWRIDLDAFEAHREAGIELRRAGDPTGAAEHFAAAWRFYRGVFLQGVYDPWAARRREELYRAYLILLRDVGEVRSELGDLERALDAYRAVLIEDPLEEAVQTEVMRIYAAQGRRDLVRRQYDRLSVLLLDELGVEPLPETTAVYHRLMA